MIKNRTLGGMACPQRCAVWADRCKACTMHRLYINDQRIYDGCQCLKPDWEQGQAIVVETADVVDALSIQWDDPEPSVLAATPDRTV